MESNFRGLYYFSVAAEELNFTRAAKRLYITQQSLSKYVKRLEEQYEVQLFERRPMLRLTLAGEQLLKYAHHVIEEESRLFRELQTQNASGTLRLRIGLPTQRCAAYLPDLDQAYRTACPNVVPSYESFSAAAASAALQSGEINLYFSTSALSSRQGRQLTLMRDELFFAVSRPLLEERMPDRWKSFLSEHSAGIPVADTAGLPLILPPASVARRRFLDTQFDRAMCVPDVVAELADGNIGFEMCARGMCGAFVPRSLLCRHFPRLSAPAPIYALRVSDIESMTALNIVYPAQSPLPPHVREYIDCARAVVPAMNAALDSYLTAQISDAVNEAEA